MIDRIRYLITAQTRPYENLALEEYLLQNVEPGECVLYLWQNRHTVVIGRNQNAWKECKVGELEADGGFLARRPSGGGAVFHDLGNLNFTFLAREEDYDVSRQLDVILWAVEKLGLKAEKTGRNDITVNGRKFSGNAFYKAGGRCYHHGTVLVKVDMENLSRYLNVSTEKLKSKGVDSVKSRVANLTDFRTDITVDMVRGALIEAFGEVYGLSPAKIPDDALDSAAIQRLTEKYQSWEWNLGKKLSFEAEFSHRFTWGDIQIQLKLDGGKVSQARAYSDAMDFAFAAGIPQVLKNCVFSSQALAAAVRAMPATDEETQKMREDMAEYLLKQNL